MSERDNLIQLMAKAHLSYGRHPALRSPVPMQGDIDAMSDALTALEAAGVRLVPVAWTDDDQTGLNAAVYDAMWHWEDRPIDVDDAMSLASALKASISDNGLMIVSAALKEPGQ